MTQIAITEQVETIKKVTKKALKSKEAARKFLRDAGIIPHQSSASSQKNTTKSKAK